jgi:hypothetical protein
MKYTVPILLLLLTAACSRAPKMVPEVVAVRAAEVPANPGDPAWNGVPEHVAQLLPQDLVEPRLLTPSTPEVRVRAITDGSLIALRLEWSDANRDDAPGPGKFVDACAIQVPAKIDSDLPDPQMGQPGKGVQVVYWRADWQASVDGRGDTIQDLYPNASVDHYPFQAKGLEKGSEAEKEMARRYAPALALGKERAGPRTVPVENLIAEGPGTLAPGGDFGGKGKGVFGEKGWSVVIIRKLPEGLAPNLRTHVALAVWQGSNQETGARKMRSGWIPLLWRGDES